MDCKRVDYDWLALSGCEVAEPLNEDQHCCSLFVLNSGMHADSYEVPKDRDLGDFFWVEGRYNLVERCLLVLGYLVSRFGEHLEHSTDLVNLGLCELLV